MTFRVSVPGNPDETRAFLEAELPRHGWDHESTTSFKEYRTADLGWEGCELVFHRAGREAIAMWVGTYFTDRGDWSPGGSLLQASWRAPG